jgi:hypothetical protein
MDKGYDKEPIHDGCMDRGICPVTALRETPVEREFGRLKHERALLPLRVRGIERVRLHADPTILAKLACALSRACVPLGA